jgi:ABC-type proline/glycine betaine transport system ATPase subunit
MLDELVRKRLAKKLISRLRSVARRVVSVGALDPAARYVHRVAVVGDRARVRGGAAEDAITAPGETIVVNR